MKGGREGRGVKGGRGRGGTIDSAWRGDAQ